MRRCWRKNVTGTNHSIITFNLQSVFSPILLSALIPNNTLVSPHWSWLWCLFTSPGTSVLLYNIYICTAGFTVCAPFPKSDVPRCCSCINGSNMWGRSRTHFPTDDIWKPSRLSWIKAGIKGFSPSPPWTGRELCTRWGKTMHLPQSWDHLAGVFSPHLLRMIWELSLHIKITSHCRWMITQ